MRQVLILCLVLPLAAVGQDAKPADVIVGKWEALADKDRVALDFAKDGKLHLTGNPKGLAFAFQFAGVLDSFNVQPASVPLTYKLPEAGKLEVEADLAKVLQGLGGDPKMGKVRETATVTVRAKEFTLANKAGKSLTFRRVE